jgi:hypothetical protein
MKEEGEFLTHLKEPQRKSMQKTSYVRSQRASFHQISRENGNVVV